MPGITVFVQQSDRSWKKESDGWSCWDDGIGPGEPLPLVAGRCRAMQGKEIDNITFGWITGMAVARLYLRSF